MCMGLAAHYLLRILRQETYLEEVFSPRCSALSDVDEDSICEMIEHHLKRKKNLKNE